MQDPITQQVASVIGLEVEEAEHNSRLASRRAAAVLKRNGYSRRYCHQAWNRGSRWYAPGSDVPQDYCSTSMLGIALIEGHINTR